MGLKTLRLISVFMALLWMPAGAGAITTNGRLWWGSNLFVKEPVKQPAKRPMRQIPMVEQITPGVIEGAPSFEQAIPVTAEGITEVSAEIVSVIGSQLTREGRVVNFETRYSFDLNTCSATVVVEDPSVGPRAFLASVSPGPRYAQFLNYTDDKMVLAVESYEFHLKLLCRQLQSAYLNNEKISVTGFVESLGGSNPTTLGSLRVTAVRSTPLEGFSAVEALPFASICLQGIDCTPEGVPVSFFVEAPQIEGDSPFCQVDLKINSGGTDQKVRVYVPNHAFRFRPNEASRFMQTLDSACELLLEVMGSQKTVGVVGRGSGGSLTTFRVSSPGFSNVEMTPLF